MLHIGADQVHRRLDWPSLIGAMRDAHRDGVRPEMEDLILGRGGRSLLVRASVFDGAGIGLKAVTVFAGNATLDIPKPTIQGAFLLFDEADGSLLATIDGAAITPWKTAADSALAASILARADAKSMTMIGAGAMARPLIEAHLMARPSIEEIRLWNRTKSNAEALAGQIEALDLRVLVMDELEASVRVADIVSSATLSVEPIIRGEWLKPGVHLDLVGAYRPDMREADDRALLRGRIFVDAKETTARHIGEIRIPLQSGVISEADIEGDLFDLCSGCVQPRCDDDITIFKNGGGAHLDLITAKLIYQRFKNTALPS